MNNLEIIEKKIIQCDYLDDLLPYWKFKSFRLVFTNGCFDIIHLGHVDYLSKAADLGDILIVGLNTDISVRKIKGSNRPLLDEKSRSLTLAALQFVSAIILFNEDTPEKLIRKIEPDVLVKGSDYAPEEIIGYDFVKSYGGKVVTIDFVKGYSTSSIVNSILSRNKIG